MQVSAAPYDHVGLCGERDPVVADVGGRPDVPGRGPSKGRVGGVVAFAGVGEGHDLQLKRPLGAAVPRHPDVVGPGGQLVLDEDVIGVGFLPVVVGGPGLPVGAVSESPRRLSRSCHVPAGPLGEGDHQLVAIHVRGGPNLSLEGVVLPGPDGPARGRPQGEQSGSVAPGLHGVGRGGLAGGEPCSVSVPAWTSISVPVSRPVLTWSRLPPPVFHTSS